MRGRTTGLAAVLWPLTALVGAFAVSRHDALVALGSERWQLPLTCFLAVFAVGALLTLLLRKRRWSPVVPLAVGGAVFGPALLTLPAAPAAHATAAGPDIVLVTLDTFRADHLGALGGPVATPALDGLAAQGALYTHAVTTAPLTAPAHASMLTGLDPIAHGLTANGDTLDVDTLVSELAAAGYRTGAFLSSRVLDRSTGLATGFDHYEDRWTWKARHDWLWPVPLLLGSGGPSERVGEQTVQRARDWLASEQTPAFVWVHLYDPHTPYLPPEPFRPSAEERQAAARADARGRGRSESIRDWVTKLETGFAEGQRLFYEAEIRYTDSVVGDLLESVSDDAVVIVSGDHGEGLGEHDLWFSHGADLFQPSLHVPLIVRWPGETEPGTRVDSVVDITRIAPTLRLAAGLESHGGLLDPTPRPVRAFTPGQRSRATLADRPTTAPVVASVDHAGKLIQSEQGASWYALATDPSESDPQPVPAEYTETARELAAVLEEPPEPLSEEARAALEALGYVY